MGESIPHVHLVLPSPVTLTRDLYEFEVAAFDALIEQASFLTVF